MRLLRWRVCRATLHGLYCRRLWLNTKSFRDDRMQTKIKTQEIPRASKPSPPKKIPRPNILPRPPFRPQKIPCRISKPSKLPESIKWHDTIRLVVHYSQNYSARIRGHYNESSDFFNKLKNLLLKSRAWEWENQVTFLFDSICFTSGGRMPGGEWSAHFFSCTFSWFMREKIPSF